MAADEAGYREYVIHRLDGFRRTAFLLCGDWHQADDLVSIALVKLLRHWRRVSVMEQPDAYMRRVLLRAWLDERRRPWRRERPTETVPDHADPSYRAAQAGRDSRIDIVAHLAELPPRRRAVLVLRYFCDLSVQQTAAALGCTEGTVKSQAARALDTLRARLADVPAMEE
jgi:RNA polymerase sigma-70 factor (sigma-E family)